MCMCVCHTHTHTNGTYMDWHVVYTHMYLFVCVVHKCICSLNRRLVKETHPNFDIWKSMCLPSFIVLLLLLLLHNSICHDRCHCSLIPFTRDAFREQLVCTIRILSRLLWILHKKKKKYFSFAC